MVVSGNGPKGWELRVPPLRGKMTMGRGLERKDGVTVILLWDAGMIPAVRSWYYFKSSYFKPALACFLFLFPTRRCSRRLRTSGAVH